MTRKPPQAPPPDVKPRENSQLIEETRHYKVITPLYGGGEEPAKADSVTIVRTTEVRGHLRFWWRATRGGSVDGSLKDMRRREEEIWGSPGEKGRPGPSKVIVMVEVDNVGLPDHAFEVTANASGRPQIRPRRGSNAHPYSAFPLQPKQQDARVGMETETVLNDVAFTLKLRYPENFQEDVKQALWAWETFGGIGARTRRGFGALQCTAVNSVPLPYFTSQEVMQTINRELLKFNNMNSTWPAGVPHLSIDERRYRVVGRPVNPVSALNFLLDGLKNFRQFRREGRQRNRPGRSFWPEPEEIRDLTDQRYSEHQPLKRVNGKFPRAKFGLPIIFHFKDSNRHNPHDKHSDPSDTTLQGPEIDRLASPLILRPIACADGAVGLAAILEWQPLNPGDEPYTPPGGLVLKGAPGDRPVQSNLIPDEAKSIQPLNGQPDILQAFLDFLPLTRRNQSMETKLLLVHTLSPLHAGTGQGVGVIDLPIAREKATQIPFLPGSSLKGVFRDACGEGDLCTRIFGPMTQNADDHAGAVTFGDARLLLLPVRSLRGVFAWVTSPLLLRRIQRDAQDVAGLALPVPIPLPKNDETCLVIEQGCGLTIPQGQASLVVLEDLPLTAIPSSELTTCATSLGGVLFPAGSPWQNTLKERLCIVSDDVLSFLLETATEITARIRLEEDTKTVKQGALWYEEALPAETILASLVVAAPVKAKPEEVFKTVKDLASKSLQFGGKATVGRGLCKTTLV